MRIIPYILVTSVLGLLAPAAAAQETPNLAGKWTLDMERSTGPVIMPPPEVSGRSARTSPTTRTQRTGMAGGSRQPAAGGAAPIPAAGQRQNQPPEQIEQELTIRLDRNTLRVEQVTNGAKETFQFALDGKESKNKYYVTRSGLQFEVPSTTRWEGAKLVSNGSSMVDTERGRVPVVYAETRYLSEDGSELIIEARIQSPAGSFERKLVYVRQ